MQMRSSTKTLIEALHILARDIQSQDNVANAAISEAAYRLEELSNSVEHKQCITPDINEQEKITKLEDLLNECLESMNQELSFKVRGIENEKFVVEFNIVEIPEDGYIGFSGY